MDKAKTVDDYIKIFPKEVQKHLKAIRQTIKSAAPSAEELISYGMPAYKLNGTLVYFPPLKTILDFMPLHPDINLLVRNYQSINKEKDLYNFRLMRRCH